MKIHLTDHTRVNLKILKEGFSFKIIDFFTYVFQHSFFRSPSDSTVSEDAVIEPRTFWQPDAQTNWLDLMISSTLD